jgi:hypothetical protein
VQIRERSPPVRGVQKRWDGGPAMTQPEEPDLKTYLDDKFAYFDEKFAGLDGKFGGLDAKFTEKLAGLDEKVTEKFAGLDEKLAGVTGRLDKVELRLTGIEAHLDTQDADLEHRTMSILETIEASATDSRLWASKLFAVLDKEAATKKGYRDP